MPKQIWRNIKRLFRKRSREIVIAVCVIVLLLLCMLVRSCACGKKRESDPASEKVLTLTIAPQATPTPAPQDVDPAAVVSNGGITMVNEYLAGKLSQREDSVLSSGSEETAEEVQDEGAEE